MQPLEQLQARFMAMLSEDATVTFGPGRVPAEHSRTIYRRNYRENHVQALAGTYENVLALVGPDYFRQLALRYLAAYPSHSGDLNDYGGQFADFLAKLLPEAPGGESLPYLPDMARLDWACWQVLLAPRAQGTALQALLTWPTEQQGRARLRLAPSCQLLCSDYPVYRLWCLAQGEALRVDLACGGEAVLICRPGKAVLVQALDQATACILLKWQSHTLAESLEMVVAQHQDTDVSSLFAHLNVLPLIGELRRLL